MHTYLNNILTRPEVGGGERDHTCQAQYQLVAKSAWLTETLVLRSRNRPFLHTMKLRPLGYIISRWPWCSFAFVTDRNPLEE
jgi:hypothetical protein